jgi:hypothetical protein
LGLAFGAAMTVAAFVGLLGTWGYRHINAGPPGGRPTLASFAAASRIALQNTSFRRVWLSFSLFFVAVVLNGSMSIHFLTWYVRISDSLVLSRLQGLFT